MTGEQKFQFSNISLNQIKKIGMYNVGGVPWLPPKARDPLCVKESKLEGLRASLCDLGI